MIITNTARDEARIFQALCTELDRLTALRPGKVDADTIEHTRELRDRYARAVSAAQRAAEQYELWWERSPGDWFRLASLYPTRERAEAAARRMAYLYPVTEVRPVEVTR